MTCRMLVLLMILVFSLAHGAETVQSTDSDSRSYWEITLGYASWANLGSLEPTPVDFVTEQSGRFKEQGPGIEIAYHRRRAEHGKAAFLIGGEFAGYGFDNEMSLTGYHAVTMEPSSIRMFANWGHITGSVRWIWREGRSVELIAGAGAGVYLLRFKETIDDFGVADRRESDTAPGGYFLGGLRFPVRSGLMAVRVDVRVHAYSFSEIGGAFEGQVVSGPATVLNIGVDF
jgi:hypothetical protein